VSVNAIELSLLSRRYGSKRGITDVNLCVREGELFGFLGPNGAGKTTAIRVLLGFLRPTSGTARALGRDCWRDSAAIKADVGAIPGDLRLWPWLTGHGALAMFGRIRGRDMRTKGRALAEELALDLSVPVRRMSRGMRQKLGLILALAHEPRLLILDEPTTALDPLMQDRLRQILRRMARAGHTVFFSSHTLGEVEELCERIAIVREGRIVADGTLDDLRAGVEREIAIAWRGEADASWAVPPGLTLQRRDASRWEGTHAGEVGPLLAWLAAKPVADVSITQIDLEKLFRRYYE
jgi:ABC-2 type transport system ATP-binding protein